MMRGLLKNRPYYTWGRYLINVDGTIHEINRQVHKYLNDNEDILKDPEKIKAAIAMFRLRGEL
jgi:hypothetical protein